MQKFLKLFLDRGFCFYILFTFLLSLLLLFLLMFTDYCLIILEKFICKLEKSLLCLRRYILVIHLKNLKNMSKLKQGIFGGLSGKLGNLIGSSWKGIATLRTKPLSVSNPNTSSQQEQRAHMTSIVSVAKTLLSAIIKPLWDRTAVKMSGYNAFVKANIGNYHGGTISDFSQFVIAVGKMGTTAIHTLALSTSAHTVVFTWVDDSGTDFRQADDTCYAVVLDSSGNVVGVSTPNRTRANLSITVTCFVPLEMSQNYNCYMAFRSANGLRVSNSTYRQVIVNA